VKTLIPCCVWSTQGCIIAQLLSEEFQLWVEMSLKIMRSGGVQRGKNDKIDAERIAVYALKNQDSFNKYQANSESIIKLRALFSLREKLISYRTTLTNVSNEFKQFDSNISKLTSCYDKNTLSGIKKDLSKIEKEIDNIIEKDEELRFLFKRITSVPGVGKVTAILLIYLTNEFKNFKNPRQLACYSGVVPFEYCSGKSIKSRPKVHYIANKKRKKALHMWVISASKNDPEIHQYYIRKTEEGKNKMLVINNIRNKIVHRICACVRENKLFEARNIA
jgi:transposase